MNAIIKVKNLKKHYPVKTGFFQKDQHYLRAVDGVDFEIQKGKTLGIVGESGCGKSTLGRLVLGLDEATEGSVYFKGEDYLKADRAGQRQMRRYMQMVFQDPFSSLDPRMNVYELISEGMQAYGLYDSQEERKAQVERLMDQCGLFPDQAYRHAHQFSGGQRQRICIARALATNPEFVVLDEAVSALDVSIQAQILNLLKDFQETLQLTYLFISHDLDVVQFISDDVAVMYLGQIVEYGSKEAIYENPKHPYTRALLAAVPSIERHKTKTSNVLKGELPSPYDLPKGCAFATRCLYSDSQCYTVIPEISHVSPHHMCRCHKVDVIDKEGGQK